MKNRIGTETVGVLAEIYGERVRQEKKWGQQDHPSGTSSGQIARTLCSDAPSVKQAKIDCAAHAKAGTLTWADILWEETMEALEEHHSKNLRAELIQVAAVCVNWIENIDRRAHADRKSPRGLRS